MHEVIDGPVTIQIGHAGQGKPIASAYVDDRAVAVPSNPSDIDFNVAYAAVRMLLH